MKTLSLEIIGIEEGEVSQIQVPKNIFNKIIEEKFQPKERYAYIHTRRLQNTK